MAYYRVTTRVLH